MLVELVRELSLNVARDEINSRQGYTRGFQTPEKNVKRSFFIQLLIVVLFAGIITPMLAAPYLTSFVLEPSRSELIKYRVGGTLEALAQLLSHRSPNAQQGFLSSVQASFPYPIILDDINTLSLPDTLLLALYKGEVVYQPSSENYYRILANKRQVLTLVNPKEVYANAPLHAEREYKGTLMLLQQLLSQTPQSQWSELMTRQASFFNYPISLQALEGLPLTAPQLILLKQGKIITELTDNEIKYGSGIDAFYQRVGDSNLYLSAGPISPYISDKIGQYQMLNTIFIALFMLLLLGLWLLPSWRSSRQMSVATEKFGEGDRSQRCNVYRASNFNSMAQFFNQMAGELEGLFNSNKTLTLALSSQLKRPIADINLCIKQLKQKGDCDLNEADLVFLQNDIDRLNQLISDVLRFASFQKDPPAINPTMTDASHFLQHVCNKIESNDKFFELKQDRLKHSKINIDHDLISQTLLSLLGYCSARAKTRYTLTCASDSQVLTLCFSHNGVPLSDDIKARLDGFPATISHSENDCTEINEFTYALAKIILTQHQGSLFFGLNSGQQTLTVSLPTYL